jgi:HK97 gp10 family phage protein
VLQVNTIGLDQFKAKILSAKKSIQDDVSAELQASAMEFVALAKRSAANNGGDRGTLQQSIDYRKTDILSYEVFVGTFYAPFIEFGTKSKAVVPAGLEDVASQFKGLKGTGSLSLIEAIKGWVVRKQIATKEKADGVAFVIARSIYRNGISPKPFFYKHTAAVRTNLFKRLNEIISGI